VGTEVEMKTSAVTNYVTSLGELSLNGGDEVTRTKSGQLLLVSWEFGVIRHY